MRAIRVFYIDKLTVLFKTRGVDDRDQRSVDRKRLDQGAAMSLDLFGNSLAKREGYTEYGGVEALQYYLIQKHHWLPFQVRSLNPEELKFVLAEEMIALGFFPENF